MNSNQVIFSKEQIEHLSSLYFINKIDTNLKAVSSVELVQIIGDSPLRIKLILELYFYDKKVDTLSFDLHNYEYDDIVHITKNIKDNEFLLQEIDNYLAGDIVE